MIGLIWVFAIVFNILFLIETENKFEFWCVVLTILGPGFSILVLAETCAKILKEK